MTENEALKIFENEVIILDCWIENDKDIIANCDTEDDEFDDDKELAELSLKDYSERKELFETAISAFKEIQQYREIGTVEECREAVEKQKRKKPKEILRRRGGFENHHCPNCGTEYQIDGRYTITDKYCPVCGKLLDSAFGSYCGNCGQRIVKESEKNLMEKRWSDERD